MRATRQFEALMTRATLRFRWARFWLAGLPALWLAGCAALGPGPVGQAAGGRLQPCPAAPHCVSSDAADAGQRIAALAIRGDPAVAWQALRAYLVTVPRVAIVAADGGAAPAYLHATATSSLMGFVDDVEFVLRAPDAGGTSGAGGTPGAASAPAAIAMRSASRVGYYDFGVNRARLEAVRAALRASGSVE